MDEAASTVILISNNNTEEIKRLTDAMDKVHLVCESVVTPSCSKTLHTLEKTLPDLLIIDIDNCRSDGDDGFQVIRSIRGNNYFKNLPIVVFSSTNDPHDINLSYILKVNGYLVKPQTDGELVGLMHSIKDYCDGALDRKRSNLNKIKELTLSLERTHDPSS